VCVCVCVCVRVVQLLLLMGIRKLLDLVFTLSELYWLDHMLPGEERIRREDERAKHVRAHLQVHRPIHTRSTSAQTSQVHTN